MFLYIDNPYKSWSKRPVFGVTEGLNLTLNRAKIIKIKVCVHNLHGSINPEKGSLKREYIFCCYKSFQRVSMAQSMKKIMLARQFLVCENKLSSKYTTWSIFKVTSGSACTKEIMREHLKDEWLPNHNR